MKGWTPERTLTTRICSIAVGLTASRRGATMALTRDAHDTIKARADTDPEFRRVLVEQAVECIGNGDVETAKALMRRLKPRGSSQ
jgi:hypothetical protein